MTNNLTIETSTSLQEMYYKYTHLKIGGKEVVCPYWMNNLEKGIYGPLGGKGTPGQIEEITRIEAEKEGIDLNKMTNEEIIIFMNLKKIGIDCSGFVFWMLNALDLEKGGNGIGDDIPGSKGKVVEYRASVSMLTSENSIFSIEEINKIKCGDMIRLRRGKHIMIITSIYKDGENIKKIEYAHSSSDKYTKISGVHKNNIEIIDINKNLKDQNWLEETNNENRYGQYMSIENSDGVKRLKIWF